MMNELIGWMVVIGLAAAMACIFMLWSQLNMHMRTTTELMIRSNETILARLDQLADASIKAPEQPVGVVLEKSRARRVDPTAQPFERQTPGNFSVSSTRPAGDLQSTGKGRG